MTDFARPALKHLAAALGTIVLWAAAFPAISVGVRHVDPIALAAVRFGIASLIFGPWLAWRRAKPATWKETARITLCGLLGIATYNVLLNTGQRTVPPGAASFIIATQPIFAAGFSSLIGHEKFSPAAMAGSAVSLVGVGVVCLEGLDLSQLDAGVLFVIAAAACSGCFFVLQRPIAQRYGAITSAAWTIVAGAALLIPWLPLGISQTVRSGDAMAAVGFLGMGAGVLAYVCWMSALAGLGAARAANLLFLMAPLATAFAAVMTASMPRPSTIIGGALALVGVAMVNQSYSRLG